MELNESVGQEDAGAGLEVFGECGEDGADALGGALDVVRGDGDVAAGDELDRDAVFEAAGADLGTLQVSKDADGLTELLGDGAHHADELGFLLVRAVREVEAGDVETSTNQLTEDLRRA